MKSKVVPHSASSTSKVPGLLTIASNGVKSGTSTTVTSSTTGISTISNKPFPQTSSVRATPAPRLMTQGIVWFHFLLDFFV